MTLQTAMARLIAEGSIERVRVNRYRIHGSRRVRNLGLVYEQGRLFTRDEIAERFLFRYPSGNLVWAEPSQVPLGFRITTDSTTQDADFVTRRMFREPEPAPALRTIQRDSYHSHGDGTHRIGLEEALRAIPADADGVRRSFGLEWEISSLSPAQEDKLARLLDTMPPHFTERDASLGSTGVEIIFLPLGKDKYIEVWNRLQRFCREEHVPMTGTGAHTTYGVSNANVTCNDLKIRLNRIALAVRAVGTQDAIKNLFGRNFTGYAHLPSAQLSSQDHSSAFSASRGTSAYELRLCNWEGKVEKIVEFMKATEFIFNRTFRAQDFMEIFRILGSDCSVE